MLLDALLLTDLPFPFYRPILINYGLWDQVRLDCGREFRTNTSRSPYMQTQSKQVGTMYECLYHLYKRYKFLAERHWVEINSRVNYPIKRALTWMQENNVIDMDCPVTQFCVSFTAGILCQCAIEMHVGAWNNHRIPGELLF